MHEQKFERKLNKYSFMMNNLDFYNKKNLDIKRKPQLDWIVNEMESCESPTSNSNR